MKHFQLKNRTFFSNENPSANTIDLSFSQTIVATLSLIFVITRLDYHLCFLFESLQFSSVSFILNNNPLFKHVLLHSQKFRIFNSFRKNFNKKIINKAWQIRLATCRNVTILLFSLFFVFLNFVRMSGKVFDVIKALSAVWRFYFNFKSNKLIQWFSDGFALLSLLLVNWKWKKTPDLSVKWLMENYGLFNNKLTTGMIEI